MRPRRQRKNRLIRELVAETRLSREAFIYPYFIISGEGVKEPIIPMPGIERFSIDCLLKDVEEGLRVGVNKLLLFGVEKEKDLLASHAYKEDALVARAIRALRKAFGEDLYLITDVCLCAYTTHGHCGVLEGQEVHNDHSLPLLEKMALCHAEAGADMVAPSDMMDYRVKAIRDALDQNGHENVAILSYAAKFASSYYGPFREAATSHVQGDRKSYQLDYRNSNQALLELELDEAEGADLLMVKPALAYLDLICQAKARTLLPIVCYNVSGEYAMVKMAAKAGFLDEAQVVVENFHAFKRAGADCIISYHVRQAFQNGWV